MTVAILYQKVKEMQTHFWKVFNDASSLRATLPIKDTVASKAVDNLLRRCCCCCFTINSRRLLSNVHTWTVSTHTDISYNFANGIDTNCIAHHLMDLGINPDRLMHQS